jgi:hypothetical protein
MYVIKGKERKRAEPDGSARFSSALLLPLDVVSPLLDVVGFVGSSIRWALPSVVGFYPSSLGFTLRRWALPSVVGFYPSSLGFTLRRWVLPFVVRLYPPSLGSAFRRWVLPFVVGLYLPSLGFTLRRWALPSVVGFYPSSLGFTFRRWALPFVVGFCLPSLGFTFRRWVLLPRRWALPSAVGFCPAPLCSTLHPSSLGLAGVVVASSFTTLGPSPSLFATPARHVVVVEPSHRRRGTRIAVVEHKAPSMTWLQWRGWSCLLRRWDLLVLMWFVALALGRGEVSWMERMKE